ncbi:methyltransferase domain-containing protein [Sorangium sp. So ce233]|uniref:class I SAM-dependent methyltransferase n=1 Tax=Sorangium sp. So ce233 TaxID=3133290 RepID=UPI003F604FA8
MDAPEISDLLVAYDPDTLARLPVRRSDVVERLRAAGRPGAARIAARLPARDDLLDEAAVDALLLRVHAELQRLSEEFDQGERVRSVLAPLLDALRAAGAPRPLRVVDVGCGLGYVVRWLAARGRLGADVELVGCDYNRALIESARSAARDEGLSCRFHVANAFTLREPATVYVSTGVVHHFRGESLVAFFREQARAGALAFAHFDIKPTHLSPLGAWIFHQARMREPLSRHDGILSTLRAHTGGALLSAARAGAEGLSSALFDGDVGLLPILRILHAVIGLRPDLRAPFVERLGPRAGRLGAFS